MYKIGVVMYCTPRLPSAVRSALPVVVGMVTRHWGWAKVTATVIVLLSPPHTPPSHPHLVDGCYGNHFAS